ncbi:MAG: DUF3596 domain-containing protein [Nitrosomonadales bacterium]|nr:DUF3596 domain-containing protein [Nitrosomonadales bacterium]
MASIRARKDNGYLFIDFRYNGARCREQTALEDNAANRKKVQKLVDRIEAEIAAGTFEYGRFFPGSKNAEKFTTPSTPHAATSQEVGVVAAASRPVQAGVAGTPLLRYFVETWYTEKEVEWRRSHKKNVRADLDGRVIPRWGDWEVGRITKADILAYRAELGKVNARGKETVLREFAARHPLIRKPLLVATRTQTVRASPDIQFLPTSLYCYSIARNLMGLES